MNVRPCVCIHTDMDEHTHFATPGLSFIALDKSPYRPVIGSLHIIREKAGGKFLHPPVILDTFTADAFTTAGFIGAVAVFAVFFDATISLCHLTSLIGFCIVCSCLKHLAL